jgi:hypothetical protein
MLSMVGRSPKTAQAFSQPISPIGQTFTHSASAAWPLSTAVASHWNLAASSVLEHDGADATGSAQATSPTPMDDSATPDGFRSWVGYKAERAEEAQADFLSVAHPSVRSNATDGVRAESALKQTTDWRSALPCELRAHEPGSISVVAVTQITRCPRGPCLGRDPAGRSPGSPDAEGVAMPRHRFRGTFRLLSRLRGPRRPIMRPPTTTAVLADRAAATPDRSTET